MAKAKTKRKFVGLRIDIETKSSKNIRHGVYVYSEDIDYEVLCIAYAPIFQYPGGARKIGAPRKLSLTVERDVERFKTLIAAPEIEKHAFNAQFERVALSRWLGMPTGEYLDPENWYCSAVLANVYGVFGSLNEVANALHTPINKDPAGDRLIKFFSIPMTAREQKTANNRCGCQDFHDPRAHPEEFEKYEAYCVQDVLTEAAVAASLPAIPEDLQKQFEADQRIGDRGILHDEKLSIAAVEQVALEQKRLMGKLKKLTGLDNPNSNTQMHIWLKERKYPMQSLDKAHRAAAMLDPLCPKKVRKALVLKGEASLTSVTKHKAALDCRSEDGRLRGQLRFYGTSTGREAGRGVQPQNLPRYEASPEAISRLRKGKAGREAPDTAKGSVRASLTPSPGHVLVVADYNAIEARVLGWFANEKWVMREFAKGEGKIYEATAEAVFGISKAKMVEALKQCGKCGACSMCIARQQAKVVALSMGYAGGAGALVRMGAEEAGIDIGNYNLLHAEWEVLGKPGKFHEWEPDRHDYLELKRLRDMYRSGSPRTVDLWTDAGRAWDQAAVNKNTAYWGSRNCLTMTRDGLHNRMILPSGRSIWYPNARTILDKKNPERVDRRIYKGKTKSVGQATMDVHGGLITNNYTQGTARDVLFDLIMKIERKTAKGWPGKIVLHVHDEVVLEVKEKHAERVKDDVLGWMSRSPKWAPGLPLKGEASIMTRYGK